MAQKVKYRKTDKPYKRAIVQVLELEDQEGESFSFVICIHNLLIFYKTFFFYNKFTTKEGRKQETESLLGILIVLWHYVLLTTQKAA